MDSSKELILDAGTYYVKISPYTGTGVYNLYLSEYNVVKSYTIIYNANGGNGSAISQKANIGESLQLSGEIFSRDNFRFLGWATSADGPVVYSSGETVKDLLNYEGSISLYAVWGTISATYNVLYLSTNGTRLGTGTITKNVGSTYTIYPEATFSGYDTPAAQQVAWNSVGGTITFYYTPSAVGETHISDKLSGPPSLNVDVYVSFSNRTANSITLNVKMRIELATSGGWYNNGHKFTASANDQNMGSKVIRPYEYTRWTRSAGAREATISAVITGLSADTTSVSVYYNLFEINLNETNLGSDIAKTITVSIPKY